MLPFTAYNKKESRFGAIVGGLGNRSEEIDNFSA
jgi:hypothetical protein